MSFAVGNLTGRIAFGPLLSLAGEATQWALAAGDCRRGGRRCHHVRLAQGYGTGGDGVPVGASVLPGPARAVLLETTGREPSGPATG
ncbi:hypothetical protein GCM10007147_24060 [Nocardiopsis kunsanensis]|uniref:Uncharacterized protein n=1 Tax=Nocardiopsis kunsanensis TaxID=141693 RepID=A0A918XCY5_9ACTN|nr:hypothetical protein GCM10007147_24060 [Nocardiopsis kunsanensis]